MSKEPRPAPGADFGDGENEPSIDPVLAANFPTIREVSPEAVMARMAQRVQRADNIDDLFDSLTGNSSDALVGKSFEFISVEWQPYESDRGVIPQAVVQGVDLTSGELTEFVTTGGMLVQFLRRAEVIGAFPFRARIVEKTTKRGQRALNFERV
jgi:hypothetical protein